MILALTIALLAAQNNWPKPDQRVECGPLVYEVYISRTANLFHVVDQLSAWDNSCHGQYREHMQLSAEDEELLKQFAAVRAKRRWGQGLEQTFYVPLDVETAIRNGKKDGHITEEEARAIRPVLEHFGPRVDELVASKRAILEAAFRNIDRQRMTRAATSLSKFCGVKKLVVPAFPIASPAPGGGMMDGGRLRWELDSDRLPFSVLVHETTHEYFSQRGDLLQKLVDATPGLDRTLLGEGFAYAMAPGIYGDDDSDNLAYNVGKDRANDQAWSDPGPGRFREYALGLRPLFREALENSNLEDFLPRARDVYLALREVEESGAPRKGPPKLAIAGPGGDAVRERLLDSKFGSWITRFNHDPKTYAETVPKLGSGDLLVLLVARDDSERIPADFARLSPVPAAELEKRLASGETIEKEGRVDALRVVLLVAPTTKQLAELARKSALLHD